MRRQVFTVIIFVCSMLIATSCGSDGTAGNELSSLDTAEEVVPEEKLQVFHSVPTPAELMEFIEQEDHEFNSEILNAAENVQRYVDHKAMALNFGIYSTDMIYTSSFSQGSNAIKYFGALGKLGDELDISSAFNEEIMGKMERNMEHPDSLMHVSNETYYAAYYYLEKNGRGPTLALIVAGGWLESLYIAMGMVNKFDAEDPTIARLSEQGLMLENLIGFMDGHDDKAVGEMSADLAELLQLFDQIEEVTVKKKKKTGGRMVLGGSKDAETTTALRKTKDQFGVITDKVTNMRNTITQNNI